jgi:hypothetical protein
MSDVEFPATTWDQFPASLHGFLRNADKTSFRFPTPEEMVAPPMTELSAKQERLVKFAYFNFWLAALRVYYINAAWAEAWNNFEDEGAGEQYAELCSAIDDLYVEVLRELYIHYGYDYQGPPPR